MRRLRARVRLLGRRRRRAARAIRAAIARLRVLSGRAIRAGILLGAIAGVSLAAGALAATLYGAFGFHPGRDADAWAARAPQFVGAASCAACHPGQARSWTAGLHSTVACESCHGPMAGHPAGQGPTAIPTAIPGLIAPTPDIRTTGAPTATAAAVGPVPLLSLDERSTVGLPESGPTALCLTCHRATVGRPSGFPTVDPAAHFAGPECNLCHDPHSAVAPRPPLILHPLSGMPDCTLCHSPSGMRPLPPTHPTWSGSCLACHRSTQP